MKYVIKKILCVILTVLFLLGISFAVRFILVGSGSAGDKGGAAPDVSGYDTAAKRVESAAAAVAGVTRNVREASGEVRISINDVGIIRGAAFDIADGTVGALAGADRIADGIQFIMGILDDAEKRNTEMEAMGDSRLD